jgi:hypothetical protein
MFGLFAATFRLSAGRFMLAGMACETPGSFDD